MMTRVLFSISFAPDEAPERCTVKVSSEDDEEENGSHYLLVSWSDFMYVYIPSLSG